MTASAPTWKSYEEVSRHILTALRTQLGIDDVTADNDLPGRSGTSWRVEGKATIASGEGFLIVECRRHTTKGLSQEQVAGLAFRVKDTGADGAVLVTPLPLQKGAALVAASANVVHVEVAPWSTSERFLAKFMGSTFRGVTASDAIYPTDEAIATVLRGEVTP
jgi:hypothetical protein